MWRGWRQSRLPGVGRERHQTAAVARYDGLMANPTSMSDAKKRAQAAVAQVKRRVAKQDGAPPPDPHAGEHADDNQPDGHVARTPPHPATRTQRAQSRREFK